MNVLEARERALHEYLMNTPGGYKTFAIIALNILPHSSLKIMVEELALQTKVKELQRK